jgi:hypothetical protein
MNDATAARVSRRLAVLFDVHPPPRSAIQWGQWLHARGNEISFAPTDSDRTSGLLGVEPVVARMDLETFAQLRDYLTALRQRNLELVVVMDATASMRPMIHEAAAGVESLILYLNDVSLEMRLAMVAYRDHDNPPVWEGHRLTSDVDSVRNFLYGLEITGGADYPEAVLEGLSACAELEYARHAERQIVLVGDAPPHEDDLYQVSELLQSFRNRGIVTHTVHVPMEYPAGYLRQLNPPAQSRARVWLQEYNGRTQATFAEIARLGGGHHVELTGADQLVPSIVHCTIQEAWWSAFDEFYALYLELCR